MQALNRHKKAIGIAVASLIIILGAYVYWMRDLQSTGNPHEQPCYVALSQIGGALHLWEADHNHTYPAHLEDAIDDDAALKLALDSTRKGNHCRDEGDRPSRYIYSASSRQTTSLSPDDAVILVQCEPGGYVLTNAGNVIYLAPIEFAPLWKHWTTSSSTSPSSQPSQTVSRRYSAALAVPLDRLWL